MDRLSEKLFLKDRQNVTEFLNLTAACYPGVHKLFVDPDGNFKVCERFPEQLSSNIGHVDTGYNLGAIRTLIKDWEDFIHRNRCLNCGVWMICDRCFSTAIDDQGKWETCQNEQALTLIEDYIVLLEERDEKSEHQNHAVDAQSFMAGLS